MKALIFSCLLLISVSSFAATSVEQELVAAQYTIGTYFHCKAMIYETDLKTNYGTANMLIYYAGQKKAYEEMLIYMEKVAEDFKKMKEIDL